MCNVSSLLCLLPTLLLRKDFLLPPQARDSLNNRVKEGHLENTQNKTWKETTEKTHPYFIFTLRNSLSSVTYQSNAFQHRCMWQLTGGRAHLSVCLSTSDSPFISLFLFCRCVVCVYLSQQQALRLQLQLNSVLLVVQELLQLQVLKSAQRAVVLPVNCDLHLPRLKRRHPAVSTERKAALNKLFGACVQVCGKEIVYWPFQAPQWTSGPRPALPQSSKQSDPPLCYPASAPHSPQLNTHANQWFPSLMNPKMHKIIKKN